MTKRKNETREEYLERCRDWEKEHRPMSEEERQRVGKLNSERQSKQVRCVETGEIFESAKKATEITSINDISYAARGLRKTAGGYHWEYL